MKIRFVSRGRLREFRENYEGVDEELLLFGFDGMGEVSYEKELKNESDEFEQIALLTKTSKGVAVCGCTTDTRGLKRKSAVVAENGKLIGVSDTLHAVDGEVSAGAALRVYETKLGKTGRCGGPLFSRSDAGAFSLRKRFYRLRIRACRGRSDAGDPPLLRLFVRRARLLLRGRLFDDRRHGWLDCLFFPQEPRHGGV